MVIMQFWSYIVWQIFFAQQNVENSLQGKYYNRNTEQVTLY